MDIKQKIFRISILMLATFLAWYMIISFVEWDINWIKYLSDATGSARALFVLGIGVKILLDFWAWSYIKDRYFDRHAQDDRELEKKNRDKLRKHFN